jgi:hypothetical protein
MGWGRQIPFAGQQASRFFACLGFSEDGRGHYISIDYQPYGRPSSIAWWISSRVILTSSRARIVRSCCANDARSSAASSKIDIISFCIERRLRRARSRSVCSTVAGTLRSVTVRAIFFQRTGKYYAVKMTARQTRCGSGACCNLIRGRGQWFPPLARRRCSLRHRRRGESEMMLAGKTRKHRNNFLLGWGAAHLSAAIFYRHVEFAADPEAV